MRQRFRLTHRLTGTIVAMILAGVSVGACTGDDDDEGTLCAQIETAGTDAQYDELRGDIERLNARDESPGRSIVQPVTDRVMEVVGGTCPDAAVAFVRQLGLSESTVLDYSTLEPDVHIVHHDIYEPWKIGLHTDGQQVVTVYYAFTCARGDQPTRGCE